MMTLPYAFTGPGDFDRYGMTPPTARFDRSDPDLLIGDQADAEAAGYGCGVCLDTEHLAYTDGTDSPCPACRPRLLTITDDSRRNPA